MNKKEKLHIAKEVYRTVSITIENAEGYMDARVNCMWPGYISIDGTVFEPKELKEEKEYDGN